MLEELVKQILKFRDERNWNQFHTGKDLALSITLEAAELLENFQWSGTDLNCYNNIDDIKAELADIIIYCILLADCYNINLETIIAEKLEINKKKYPVDLSKDNSTKYSKLKK